MARYIRSFPCLGRQLFNSSLNTAQRQSRCGLATQNAPGPKLKSPPEVQIRTIRRKEVALLNDMWARADIDIGEDHMDSIATYVAPEGYLVAVVDGKVVGSCVNVVVNNEIGIQGGLICEPEYQNLGIARKVRFEGAELIKDRNLSCDAAPQMADVYQRWGFPIRDYISSCFSGTLDQKGFLDLKQPELPAGHIIVPQKEMDFRDLNIFDQSIHPEGSGRMCYMKWLLDRDSTIGNVVLDEDDKIVALGIRTSSMNGKFQLGPIYAQTPVFAEALLRELVAQTPDGATCDMMAPAPNKEAVELMAKTGLKEIAQGVRMYTKGVVDMKVNQIFSYTTAGFAGFLLC